MTLLSGLHTRNSVPAGARMRSPRIPCCALFFRLVAVGVFLEAFVGAPGVAAQDSVPVSPRRKLDLSRPPLKGWDPVTFRARDVIVNKAVADAIRAGTECATDERGWLDCTLVFRGTLLAIMKDPEKTTAQFTIHQKDKRHWIWLNNAKCLNLVVAGDSLMPKSHMAANGAIPEQSVIITAFGEVVRTSAADEEELRQLADFETQRCRD